MLPYIYIFYQEKRCFVKQHNVPISNQSALSSPERNQPSRQQESNLTNQTYQSQSLSSPPSFEHLTTAQMMHLQKTIGNQAFLQLMKTQNTSNEQNKKNSNENNTGLPDRLKFGVETLSGMSMDDINVHYNSSEPSQFQAEAYAQGTDIHLGPGQERHLPHEAWHVVQQKQDRVKPPIHRKKSDVAPIQFAGPGSIKHALNSCYVAAIINTFTVVQSLKRLLLSDRDRLVGPASDLQNLLLRSVNTVDATQTVPQVWIENIMLALVNNKIIDNVGDSEDVNSTMSRLIEVLTNGDITAAQDNNMPVSSGIVIWDNTQTVNQALEVSLNQQQLAEKPPNSVHINRQQENNQAAPQQFTYGNGVSAVNYRLRSAIHRDVKNFGGDHFVSYIDRGNDEQEWYESEDVHATVKAIDNLSAVGNVHFEEVSSSKSPKEPAQSTLPTRNDEAPEELPETNIFTSAISYVYERVTIDAPEQAVPPVIAPLADQKERTENYERDLVGLGCSLAISFQKKLLAKYENTKDRKGISDPLKDLEASQTLDSLLENEAEASGKMADLLGTGVVIEDIRTLASRTIIGKANLLKNIQENDPGFIREVLVALNYVRKWGSENVLIQFGSAQLKSIKAVLRYHKFNETADALNDSSPEDFLQRLESDEYGWPVGADIIVWVKNSKVGKNTFIQSKNISGGGGDWKTKIKDYVSYAAGQLAGYNLQEFSIADKAKDTFEGIALITYDAGEDLLDSKNRDQLISKIKDGLKRLHNFDFLNTNDVSSASSAFIGRQIKYTSKVIITVPSSKKENKTFVFDVKTQAQEESRAYSSDISSLKINTSLSRAMDHNEVTEEELELANSLAHIDDLFAAQDDMTYSLFQACKQSICDDRTYGEVFEQHFLAGIAESNIDKFLPRFKRYAYLAFLKNKEVLKRGKSQKLSVEEQSLDSLIKLYSAEYSKDRDPDQLMKEKPKTTKKTSPPSKKGNAKTGATVAKPTTLDEIRDYLSSIAQSDSSDYEALYGEESFEEPMREINWKEIMKAIGVTIIGLTDEEEDSD